ncbi:hypothetical protein AVEN_167961-1 [Araneus ventricosus]|uniref:Uncharacterized protein n=1 Tax=Araneus ventricosus TaxID=182803 RepID=A0A4Y2X9G9_ARAVE|nr:hypothetical protein AVEN_167961-1 [Araneus ventricosus]
MLSDVSANRDGHDVLALVNLARKKRTERDVQMRSVLSENRGLNDILLNCGCVVLHGLSSPETICIVSSKETWNVRDTKGRLESPEVEYPPFE